MTTKKTRKFTIGDHEIEYLALPLKERRTLEREIARIQAGDDQDAFADALIGHAEQYLVSIDGEPFDIDDLTTVEAVQLGSAILQDRRSGKLRLGTGAGSETTTP